jgi:hypothetical protein
VGENVLHGQVKSFRKGRDREVRASFQQSLFTRPEIITTTYCAMPLADAKISNGERLFAQCGEDSSGVQVVRGHRPVARIDGDGAAVLRTVLQPPGNPGLIELEVTAVSEISGYLTLAIAPAKDAQ